MSKDFKPSLEELKIMSENKQKILAYLFKHERYLTSLFSSIEELPLSLRKKNLVRILSDDEGEAGQMSDFALSLILASLRLTCHCLVEEELRIIDEKRTSVNNDKPLIILGPGGDFRQEIRPEDI